ncbi:MAG: ribosomal protein S19 family protein [Candidatus Diapherotrites archaeon]|nr:ribosomal protein S19 family protein [Candidatus Diapherotrites archaeon]
MKNMTYQEFAALCNSRARRSLLRHGIDKGLEKRILEARKLIEKNVKDVKPIRTHRRDTIIVPQMLGLKFGVYNGKEFTVVEIVPEMLGHYLGEFALTRKRLKHGKAGIGATRSSTAIARK